MIQIRSLFIRGAFSTIGYMYRTGYSGEWSRRVCVWRCVSCMVGHVGRSIAVSRTRTQHVTWHLTQSCSK